MIEHISYHISIPKNFKERLEDSLDLIEYDEEFIKIINEKKLKDKRFKNKKLWTSTKFRLIISQWMDANASKLAKMQLLKLEGNTNDKT